MKTLLTFLTALFLTLPTLAALQPEDGVFRIGNDTNCIFVEDSGFSCFEKDFNFRYYFSLKHPNRAIWEKDSDDGVIAAGYFHTCDTDSFKCRGSNTYGQTNIPANPKIRKQIAEGKFHTCTVYDGGVVCWGDYNGIRNNSLVNPDDLKQLVLGLGRKPTCSIDEERFRCWEVNSDGQGNAPKSIGQKHKVSFGQNILTSKLLAKFVSKSRRDFLMGLQSANSICTASSQKSYFQCKALVNGLIAPSILSADSAIALNDIIPVYQEDMSYSRQQIGAESLNEALAKSPNTSTNREYALSVISSALKVSLNFFTPEEQRLLKEALRTTGQSLANPTDNARTIEVVRAIERLTIEKSALRESTKSAFLADVMDLSAQWLQEKVR